MILRDRITLVVVAIIVLNNKHPQNLSDMPQLLFPDHMPGVSPSVGPLVLDGLAHVSVLACPWSI